MRSHILSLLLAPFLALPAAATSQTIPPEEAPIRADVGFLAADALRGREAGTNDFDVAAEYVVSRMTAAGLTPGAAGQWLQPVALGRAVAATRPALVLVKGAAATPLVFGTDYGGAPVIAAPAAAAVRRTIEGRLVFAGYGIVDPVLGRDDYKGLDAKGAIVVMMRGVPAGLPRPVAAVVGDMSRRARTAAAHGAVGVIYVTTDFPPAEFAAAAEQGWRIGRTLWLAPDGTPRDEGAPALATVTTAGAAKLFAGARLSLPAIVKAEEAGGPLPTGPLATTLRYTAAARTERRASGNVVGLLPGSDPKLAREYVVMSAHLDHLGIVPGPDGSDRIANGAQDNAVGVALMLDVARRFQAAGIRPRRPILFVALTGEEKGLLGSDYLVAHPPVPAGARIVADLNLDMPVLLSPLRDVVAHGGDRSTLGRIAAAAAQANGLTVATDWEPEQGRFARSDQFSFALAGIPALSLKAGPSGGSDQKQRAFAKSTYHTPRDDLTQPIEWSSAPLFARLNTEILRRIADADAAPTWNAGDYFGERARRGE
ncbi:M20/M25/M40 family metallo-hydrolase [Sphingomonas sp. KR1UV-12]|uniref:M20/M25/M40 family metallo-hydrolase n=1 Tax=Sphingomonas aurea TaxID=3063994 RepID=A0ABT9ELF1_9SPHN|nr:M20/M25/M40 family metallo-hydrolase [Sphingomonas sp. KR1UV-12]MDP1027797.1 M20/M25/M40 family metallo-hydrolase [Sphingomonas sp. KR1UV-12]